jgi:quercetin dioxygenase-like cupin family protein
MDLQAVENKYRDMGLVVFRQSDKANVVYKPHRHEEVRIYTIKGSVKVRLDDDEWQTVKPGQEIIIREGQLHEAMVGADGWEYIFATTSKEAKRQDLL